MSRFKLTVSCEFDSAYPMTAHTDLARSIVGLVCPQNFDLINSEKCDMTDCRTCWFRALEAGVCSYAKSVHVERLD